MVYVYAGIRAGERSEERLGELRKYPIAQENIFSDKMSGKQGRSGYLALKQKLRRGDLLVLPSLEDLGNNYETILREWRELTERIGVHIKVQKKAMLDTRRGEEILQVVEELLECMAEREREKSAIQARRIRNAKERGVQFGRPQTEYSEEFIETAREFHEKRITLEEAMRRMGVKKSGVYYHTQKLIELGVIAVENRK